MKCRLFLNVVIGKGPAVLELFPGKYETLLVGWYSFFVLNLRLDVFDRVARFNLECNSFARECFYEYLHLYYVDIKTCLVCTQVNFRLKVKMSTEENSGTIRKILEDLDDEEESLEIRVRRLIETDLDDVDDEDDDEYLDLLRRMLLSVMETKVLVSF